MKQVMAALAFMSICAPAYAQFGGLDKAVKKARQAEETKKKLDDLTVSDEEERKIGEDVLCGHPIGNHTYDGYNGHPHMSDAGHPTHLTGIYSNALELHGWPHPWLLYVMVPRHYPLPTWLARKHPSTWSLTIPADCMNA